MKMLLLLYCVSANALFLTLCKWEAGMLRSWYRVACRTVGLAGLSVSGCCTPAQRREPVPGLRGGRRPIVPGGSGEWARLCTHHPH